MKMADYANMPHQSDCAASGKDSGVLLDQALFPVRGALDEVTKRLASHLNDPIARMVDYLVSAGGKRLRPALVLLCGASGRIQNHRAIIDTAAAVEILHTATLIHDDIIDQSQLRRSQPTFHARWGTERAVLMGDYLYASAFTLLSKLEVPYVMHVMADVCQQLSRGEMREVETRYRFDLSEKEYLDIIRDKTASLIGGCCQCGAYLGGVSSSAIMRFAGFGLNFGLAFQIIDDCLDLIGKASHLGKSTFADLEKGALSLPIIYLSQTLSAAKRKELFAPLMARDKGAVFLERVAEAATTSGAISKAKQRAKDFAVLAQAALSDTPLNGLSAAYQYLAEYVVARQA